MSAEYTAKIQEDFDDLSEAVARARELQAENVMGSYAVSGEGVHLTIVAVPTEGTA
jgi:hypothetical protein